MKTYCGISLVLIMLILSSQVEAQKTRFDGHYPLSGPKKESDIKAEYEKTVTAMLGGTRILTMATTPTKREDPEAFIKDDYKNSIEEMNVYAIELCGQLGTDYADKLKKISKSIKSNKFMDAISSLEAIGATNAEDSEVLYFVWKEYMGDRKENAPWVDPKNIKITRIYRMMLTYVAKTYDRPFGAHAEHGAIVADAAQALSNCLENPQDIGWKGDSKMSNMKKEDELKRLASNVAYYNWRMHDRISGKRAATIDVQSVRHVQVALYDIVRTIIQKQDGWDSESNHGVNLLNLFIDTQKSGWNVNGDKAQKKGK